MPVPVKIVVTQDYLIKKHQEIEREIEQLHRELEQIQFQKKKLIMEVNKKGLQAIHRVEERIQFEKERREEKLTNLTEQTKQLEKLNLGDEILYRTVEAEIDVKVGDQWDQIQHSQIIIKDGIVIEIRKGANK